MREMQHRNYKVATEWYDCNYRGKLLGYDYSSFTEHGVIEKELIYHEHNKTYLRDCIDNLKNKGIEIPTQEIEREQIKSA
jgi:uncharacterized protein (TIGR02328 family)